MNVIFMLVNQKNLLIDISNRLKKKTTCVLIGIKCIYMIFSFLLYKNHKNILNIYIYIYIYIMYVYAFPYILY